jgi:hypothetical protein
MAPRRLPVRASASLAVVLLALAAAGCAGGAASSGPSASSGASASAGSPAPASASTTAGPGEGAIDPAVPTACIELSAEDCERARAQAATALAGGERPIYVQVGPFGCAAGDRCPTTLVARPEGDVWFELAGGLAASVHLRFAPDGTVDVQRQEAIGIGLEPTSARGVAPGPNRYTLGHCGIFSGIDLDGSWWDPVGPVSFASGEAINATAGTITLTDPDHGTFVAPGGLSLRLQRHPGVKFLPLCA